MRLLLATVFYILILPAQAWPIDVWNSQLGWAQGYSSFELTFDAQDLTSPSGIEDMTLKLDMYDATGKRVDAMTISLEPFGDSSATRFSKIFVETKEDVATIVIWKATGMIDYEEIDLLETNRLYARESPLKESVQIRLEE